MVTKTAKSLTRFTSLLLALGLLLGLTVVGCSDEDRDTNQHPAADALINYAFQWAGDENGKVAAEAVTAEAKAYDAEGAAVDCSVAESEIEKMEYADTYRYAEITTKSNATELHVIFKDAEGNVVADRVSAVDFSQSLELAVNDDNAKDAEYTLAVDFSAVTEAVMAIDTVEEVMIDEAVCELGEDYTAVAEKGALLPGEHAVSFNVGAEEWVPATATFDAADAVDYVITVALTDDNFTAEPIPGAPEVNFYPAEATAEAIAAGEVEAIETIDVDVEATADFTVFAVVGNPTEAASYTELARDAETLTVSGLEDNAFVTLAEDAWTLTGVAATEEAQKLTLSYQTEDMEEAATAELAITVGGAVVGAPAVAFYPAEATAAQIAAGEVTAIESIEVPVGESKDFTVFAVVGNPEEEASYTAIARDASEATVELPENEFVTLAEDAWTLTGVTACEEAQTLTLSYKTEDMEEAATAALAITVTGATGDTYTLVADYSAVTDAVFAIADVTAVAIGENTAEIADNKATVEDAEAGTYNVVFTVGEDEFTAADVEFSADDADEDGVITVALTDDNFDVEVGETTIAIYNPDTTAAQIAAGEATAITSFEVGEGGDTANFVVFACTGNPEEEDSYTEIARDATGVTATGLEDNAYVTLADDAWTLTGATATEDVQTLTISYQTEDMEEPATAELAITVISAA